MKKTILFTVLALLGITQAVAQEYEYVPFVREGVKWEYTIRNPVDNPGLPEGNYCRTLEMRGDVVINGKTYKAVHKYSGEDIDEMNDTVPIYLREDNKVVYGIVPEGVFYPDCAIGCGIAGNVIANQISLGEEFVLYDFNDPKDFYENLFAPHANFGSFGYLYSDNVIIGGTKARRHIFNLYGCDMAIIEGIGYDGVNEGYPLAYMDVFTMSAPHFRLSRVIQDGCVIYEGFYQKSHDNSSSHLPLARAGVKWVNERVTVENGDTIYHYYTYKFNGKDCYSNSSTPTEVNQNIVVAKIDDQHDYYGITECFVSNDALDAVIAQGREMIDFTHPVFGGTYLYMFLYNLSGFANIRDYYMACQKEPFLTVDNFMEVDPITIEGIECERYAYIGEDGDTLAYVVEGIGFDSRDMGDLLTPFTRRPDPSADYQECCGLCHVVKDGKVIYKGMRYSPDNMTGLDEVVADKVARPQDDYYYDLMGRRMGTEVPQAPGIYIHHGNKIVVR